MGNLEMRPLVQFAPNDQIADLYGRLMVHWEPPQHYVRQDIYDAALARAAEAEARETIMRMWVASLLLEGRTMADEATNDEQLTWGTHIQEKCAAALAAGPGPLLALAQVVAQTLDAAWPDAEAYPANRTAWVALKPLNDAYKMLPAWLREYLLTETEARD